MKSNRDKIRELVKDELMHDGVTDYVMQLMDNAVFASIMDSDYREEYTAAALKARNETATAT